MAGASSAESDHTLIVTAGATTSREPTERVQLRRRKRDAARKEARGYQEQEQGLGPTEGQGEGAKGEEKQETSKKRELSSIATTFIPVGPDPVPAVLKEEWPPIKEPEMVEAVDKTSVRVDQGQLLRSRAVKALLAQLVRSGTFVLSSIKREVNAEFYRQTKGEMKLEKPHGLSIGDMFDPFLCIPGDTPIDPVGHCLKIERFDEFHRRSCLGCGNREEGDFGGCYYEQLRACVTHGWDPPMHRDIVQQYQFEGNNKLSGVFSGSLVKELATFEGQKVIVRLKAGEVPGLIVNPLGVVIKGSDRSRAKLCVGKEPTSQASLDAINTGLEAKGHKKIKTRCTVNATATGVNASLYVPPFSMPNVTDALSIVSRDDWLTKADVARYYIMFPLAQRGQWRFGVSFLGVLYMFVMVFFGLSSAPYYTSVWGAEFRRWMLAFGVIKCSHMIDDWLFANPERVVVLEQYALFESVMNACGFELSDKKEVGQQIEFLGILLDTRRMIISFDPVKIRARILEVSELIGTLEKGKNQRETDIRSMCGKLNWLASLVQSGRCHLAAIWKYSREGRRLDDRWRKKMIADLYWWVGEVLESWASGQPSDREYKIMSASELLMNDCELMHIIQSDMAGDDGYGYFHGRLSELDPQYRSWRWVGDFKPHSSTWGELKALLQFMQDDCPRERMLVWVSDSLAAVFSVNNGRAKEFHCAALVEEILELCDVLRVQIVALWVPREENELADYLSHLSFILNRDSVGGVVSGLARDGTTDRTSPLPREDK